MGVNVLKRHDGSISKTKILNMVTAGLIVASVILEIWKVHIPGEIYATVAAILTGLNQWFRTKQTRL